MFDRRDGDDAKKTSNASAPEDPRASAANEKSSSLPSSPADAKDASTSGPRRAPQPMAPIPSLPKGGGAIRGVDEKFSANPVSGTGSFSIPLPLSPGRGGFGPQLSLTYDSGAGNGPFGAGWQLSIPRITRKTDKGLPRYDDAHESDVFLLSGAEDLVPARSANGSEADAYETETEHIARYRPRVEGAFARIERHRVKADGNVYWTATTPDNTTSVYGKSEGARIADPAHPARIFSWLLEETRDDKGNVVTYAYKAEDLTNVSPAEAPETHRHKGLSPMANLYLKRIRYGNTTAGDATAAGMLFETVFDYGEHDATTPTVDDSTPWPRRQDPFSTYRSGFEIRSYRLCRRVLVFHRMEELGETPCLVRSLDLTYTENPVLSRLASATMAGYIRDEEGAYTRKAFPPTSFTYSEPVLHTEVAILEPEGLRDLPRGIAGHERQWIDLDGEAIPGLLLDEGDALYYKKNLGNGLLAPALALRSHPGAGATRLVDIDADGRKEMVVFERPVSGYFDRTDDGWAPFRPFPFQPVVDWNDPTLRLIDLNGDGHDDILIAGPDTFTWYPSLAKGGFDKPIRFTRPSDETRGPLMVFDDGKQCLMLADMSGDGLVDLVWVRNGNVCYWPNLGHGRFGAKVQMVGATRFDNADLFHTKRLRFADVDGSGTADIIYLRFDGPRVYMNQAGNSFADPVKLPLLPTNTDLSTVMVTDILGTGTGCLVWNATLPDSTARVRYIDLLGRKKPHLLTQVENGLGLTTTITYAPSTKFYLADQRAGRPWITKLPFVVQVVERVEHYDAVSRHRFVSTYAYHHGDYDGIEREMRGFGMVEQQDTEAFSAFSGAGFETPPENADPELHVPPVLTKTWFHTGAWFENNRISRQYEREYYAGDADGVLLPDTILTDAVLPSTPALAPDEMREACRALKGHPLRQEVYALDGTASEPHPYVVTETSYLIRRLQPAHNGAHAVFLTHAREALEHHYERNAADPRISHAVTLEVDAYGTVKRTASIGYRRREATTAFTEQAIGKATLTEQDVLHLVPAEAGAYRLGLPIASRTYELTGLPLDEEGVLDFATILAAADGATAIAYDDTPSSGAQKRLLAETRVRYLKDDLSGPCDFGAAEGLGFVYETYTKLLPASLLETVFDTLVTSTILEEGGYVQFADDDDWWAPSGRAIPSAAASFYLPTSFVDPFGNTTEITYDDYNLLVIEATDPLDNTVTAVPDYRVLGPAEITDPNGNVTAASFDALGMVIATAVMGKPGADEGDTLEDPTVTFEYDLDRFRLTGKPNVVHMQAREKHGEDNPRWQETYIYSDGSGNEVLHKVQAEPGDAPARDEEGALVHDEEGNLVWEATETRWVGNGRTILDNKGHPVKQYEPFFSSTYEYEDETELVEWGVTPILHYDPVGRLIRTDSPNGTFSKVTFDPWQQTSYDPNDTVLESDWYATRHALSSGDPDRRAADLTEDHADTPTISYLDALGRTFRTVADNGSLGQYITQTTLDIEGQPLVITDARGNTAATHVYGMGAQLLYQGSNDAGERQALVGVTGQPLRLWTERGFAFRSIYDALRRATHQYVLPPSDPERLALRAVFGEAVANATDFNLRGRPYLVYDGAGVAITGSYDFKGNLLESSRRLRTDVHADADWSALAELTDVDDITDAADADLESETFTSATAYDALNRPVSHTAPDASEIKPTYNEASLLESVEVRIRDDVAWTTFVENIDYDAKGRREAIDYGNGTSTAYTYDPLSFRLTRLKTTRSSDNAVLQNLSYTYDPVGNITEITDTAQQTVFFNNAVVSPSAQYTYDAIYRLIEATGREHAGGIGDDQRDQNDLPINTLPHPNDASAVRTYTEQYEHDAVGNLLKMIHAAGAGSWTRRYAYEETSNRLVATSLPGDDVDGPYSAEYTHDVHGNMTSMPHLSELTWDEHDQLRTTDLGGGGIVYYVYDAAGQRVRKVWEHSGLVEERIYLGGWEVYRKRDSGGLLLERETLHVMDDARRVAMVETKTVDTSGPFTVTPRMRFQLDNHLGSACLEVDETGLVIGYEEYHPYGTTSYWSGASGVEVSARRYRYTGKEKDEETGLYYHGARYYACWLGRWTSADPAGTVDGFALYTYVRGNPVRLHDPNGMESSVDKQISQLTDVQLHRQLKNLSPEARAEFVDAATGRFKERASATLTRGKLDAIRKDVTTVKDARAVAPEQPPPAAPSPAKKWEPGFWERLDNSHAMKVERAFVTSLANIPHTILTGFLTISLGVGGHYTPRFDLETGTKTIYIDDTAIEQLAAMDAWKIKPPSGSEGLSHYYDNVIPLMAAAIPGNVQGELGPPQGAALGKTKDAASVLGVEAEEALASANKVNQAEQWMSPRELAEAHHKALREKLSQENRGFESGRHNEYPSAMRSALKQLADESEARGDLPEYANRLREIAETYNKRAQAGHRGGR